MARHIAARESLDWLIDSAGTGAWHTGEAPDPRMIQTAANRGIDLTPLRARKARVDDFYKFDHIFAMDHRNHADLEDLCPEDATARLHLFLESDEVPDPYYGGDQGFEHVLDLIETRMEMLFRTLIAR